LSDVEFGARPTNAVVNGVLEYASPSSITTAFNCLRLWWYTYVCQFGGPDTVAQGKGKEGHRQIEHYLTTGEDVLERMARALLPWIPTPGKDLLVEWEIPAGVFDIGGVRIKGYIDLLYWRPTYVDDFGAVRESDPSIPLLRDWKFTKSFDFARRPDTIQMRIYAEVARRITGNPHALVHAAHGYAKHTGAPDARQVSAILHPGDDAAEFERMLPVVRNMQTAAGVQPDNWNDLTDRRVREFWAEMIPANTDACDNYGGCPMMKCGECSAGKQHQFDVLLGGENGMSLLAPLMTQAVDTELLELVTKIESVGRGFPHLAGEAAAAYAKLKNIPLTAGAGLTGSGEMGQMGVTLNERSQFNQLVQELGLVAPSPMPPDTPPSDPAAYLAQQQAEAAAAAAAAAKAAGTTPAPQGTPTDYGAVVTGAMEGPTVEDALKTLEESKCIKTARLGAVAIIREHLAKVSVPQSPSVIACNDEAVGVKEVFAAMAAVFAQAAQ
jgi:hypothetical protein